MIFFFAAQCNVSGEFLGEEEQAAYAMIANTPLQRQLMRQGWSSPIQRNAPAHRKGKTRPLLNCCQYRDKPEHLGTARGRAPTTTRNSGINMIVHIPHLFNIATIDDILIR